MPRLITIYLSYLTFLSSVPKNVLASAATKSRKTPVPSNVKTLTYAIWAVNGTSLAVMIPRISDQRGSCDGAGRFQSTACRSDPILSYPSCAAARSNSGCMSGAVTAISVQIRWKSPDLSLLQTPPLTTGLPKSSRHFGWLPESSLTFPYVIPTDCSLITDVFMPYGKKSCLPLTGTYYSPAICPSGWTVETTMTADDFNGPPREADETVALCCPSGMSRLPDICGIETCVSATITAKTSSLSLDLMRVRDGVQIRWAATDMAVLETHPLTPGLRIPRQTMTITPLPSPKGLYKVGIGLAMLPVLLALVAVSSGAIFLRGGRHIKLRRRGGAQRQSYQPDYKPASFSVGTLVLLIAITVTSIILLELSCHIVLRDDAPDPYARYLFERNSSSTPTTTTTSALEERRVSMIAGTTTLPMGMSCWHTTYVDSTSSTRRPSKPTTTRSTTSSITTTTTIACESSGTPIAISSSICQPGVGAPPGQKWLAYSQHGEGGLVELKGSPDGAYFFANMLPTLLASLLSIPFKIMQVDTALLEPFRQLALGGPAKRSILGNYQTFHALRAPLPFITSCLALASAAVTALSAEGWGLRIVGSCDKRISMEGCVPVVEVTPWVVRAIMAILTILALLAIVLAILSCFYKLGVSADPRSILGVATLTQSPGVTSILANVDPVAGLKTLKDGIGDIPLHLGTDPVARDYGIQRSEQTLLQQPKANKPETSYLGDATQLGRMPVAKLAFLFACFTVFLIALTTLTIYYLATSGNTKFERFMSGEGFGPRFIFAICGVAVSSVGLKPMKLNPPPDSASRFTESDGFSFSFMKLKPASWLQSPTLISSRSSSSTTHIPSSPSSLSLANTSLSSSHPTSGMEAIAKSSARLIAPSGSSS
ncbi:hypothetical protein DM02DRAFT_703773, partial [Periconia macrospinosa]